MKYYLNNEAVTQDKIDDIEKSISADSANKNVYEKAIRIYSGMLVKDPKNSMLYRNRGHRYLSLGNYEQAAADLTIGTMLEPDYWKNWHYLGMISYLVGNYEKALEYYDEALKVSGLYSKFSSPIINWKYLALRKLGRDDEALKTLESFPLDLENCLIGYKEFILMNRGIIHRADIERKCMTDRPIIEAAGYQYAIAMNYYYEGDTVKAKKLLKSLCEKENDIWFSFGYMAAMSDIKDIADEGE